MSQSPVESRIGEFLGMSAEDVHASEACLTDLVPDFHRRMGLLMGLDVASDSDLFSGSPNRAEFEALAGMPINRIAALIEGKM